MHSLVLVLLLLQAPGDGWSLGKVPPREVKTFYWELFGGSETFVSLIPVDAESGQSRVRLVFQAFFNGKELKDAPKWINLRVLPLPLTVIKDFTLRLVVDEDVVDLGATCSPRSGAGSPCQLLFPLCDNGCSANGVLVNLEPALLRRMATATTIMGLALGFPITLSSKDRAAVAQFAETIHIGKASEK